MSGGAREGGAVRPAAAVALATTAFFALLIFGLGMLSLATDRDVIAVPGLGQIPGIVATAAATAAFAGTLALAVRRPRPSFWNCAWIAATVFLVHLAALGITAVATGAPVGRAAGAVGAIAASGFALVIGGAAAVCAWGGIALVRTRARRPRWPWEGEED